MRRFSVSLLAAFFSAALSATASAQRRVSGQVSDSAGTAIPAATVLVQGTTIAAVTNTEGQFVIDKVPAGAQTLVVRRIGFRRTAALLSSTANTITILVGRDPLQLDEVVVTGQATSVSTQNAANAVTIVNSAELQRAPQPNIENALQGKVPGAVITQNSGAPGGGVQVQIRGSNTVNGNYQPLYVIDGVIVDNTAVSIGLNSITGAGGGITSNQDQMVNRVADLNPEDIQDIQILKGPSAGAIYGSRGANGVIVITTKKGQAGAPSFNIIQRLGTQTLANKYDLRCFTFDQAVAEAKADFGIDLTQADYAGCVDPQEIIYGNHLLSYETNMSLHGGFQSSGTSYFLSGTVKHDGGLSVNSGYSKQSLRTNLAQLIGSKLNLTGSTEILHTLTERGIFGNDNNNIAPYTIMGATPTYFDPRRVDPTTGALVKDPFIAGGANVLQDEQSVRTPEDVFRLIGNLQADWSILTTQRQALNFTMLGGVDAYNDHSFIYSPPNTYVEQSGNISPFPGSVVDGNADVVNANLQGTLIHKITMRFGTASTSAGFRQEHQSFVQDVDRGQGLFPGITNFATAVQTAVTQLHSLTKTFSYFAQEEFLTLQERLMVTAAINGERSSTNGDSAKFYAFPKFAVSYNMPLGRFGLDNAKFRLSTGQAGNRVPVNFKYTFLNTIAENGIVGLLPSAQIGLANVKPEVTSETEGGVDLQMLGGRAQAEITGYKKRTTGLVLTAAPAPSSGFTSQVINGGSLTNSGIEVGLNMIPIQTRAFTWQSHETFSHNRGLVTSLPVPAFYTGSGFGERTARTKVQVGYAPDEVVAFTGFDSTGVNRLESFFGSESPDFEMGFGNDLTFGNVRLSSLVEWRHGGFLADLSQTYPENGVNGQSAIAGGNLADTAMNNADQANYAKGFPSFLEHASFAKLRELTLSVGLNSRLTNTLFRGTAKDARIELSGRNLWTWTHYRGLDPEVSNFSNSPLSRLWDLAPYPPSRQFMLSVNANF
ncbi:MAG TPA: SusC/RagA family TonB-linked outer membrane protein [Gemmatimonadaceae bacterium]|nr:SusC/RagA family TonB-linked outer membrane protein [Gemmatimonadaceae bacterium]